MRITFTFCSCLLAALVVVFQASAQGTTAFTYQGQIQDTGTNANGTYTVICSLYDSVVGGNEIGNPNTNSVTMVNGLFSVNLDFGAGAFGGGPRWLDITIQNGSAGEELTPRVQILPTPYAQFASVAGSVTNLSFGAGLSVVTNGDNITVSGTGATLVASNNDYVPFCSVGKAVAALNVDANSNGIEYTVLSQPGAGCLTHMYFSGYSVSYMRIRVYVDGESMPSIDMANDLGTGYAFGGYSPSGTTSPPGNSQMGQYGGIYNNYHIPFSNGIKVTVVPMTPPPTGPTIWWIISGTANLPCTVAGYTLPSTARLHLYRNEWLTAQPLQEFNLCSVTNGHGMVYQVTVAAQETNGSGNFNYMEGEVRGYFNGSTNAVPLSSGTEDFFEGAGYFHQNQIYDGESAGLTSINPTAGINSFSAYRLFTHDPLFFQNGLRLTLRCGEQINGQTLYNPQPTAYATYTWVYQW